MKEDDLQRLLMDFRELRSLTVSHLAIQASKTSLYEIERSLKDQFLALSIALGVTLAVTQTVIMEATTDLSTREVKLTEPDRA